MRHSCLVNARRITLAAECAHPDPCSGCTGDGVVPSPVHRAERLTIPAAPPLAPRGETTSSGTWSMRWLQAREITMTIRETFLSRQRITRYVAGNADVRDSTPS